MKTKKQKNSSYLLKIRTFIVLLFLCFFSFSCNNDDEKVEPIIEPITNPLITKWDLIKHEGGFAPTYNYNNMEIQWSFNFNNTVDVQIVNGTTVGFSLPLKFSGNYSYSVNNNQIILDNIVYNYVIDNNVLKIEEVLGQASDGKITTFVISQ